MRTQEPFETALALAERRVRDSEDCIARQLSAVLALECDGQWDEAQSARRVLAGFQRRLGSAWERLQAMRWMHDHGR